MVELFEIVNKHCDIRLLKTGCNFRACKKAPQREMLIYQIDMSTAKKKDIISIYLCLKHYSEMEKVLENIIGRFKSGKIYKIKQPDESGIRVITY